MIDRTDVNGDVEGLVTQEVTHVELAPDQSRARCFLVVLIDDIVDLVESGNDS